MENQSGKPDQGKGSPSTGLQQLNRKSSEGMDEKITKQEECETTNTSSSGNSDNSKKERSFYKNDLPENEEGTDVDERSSDLQP
ncbi:MAG TPA: hypothetical protein VMZ03_07860 [Chitinophagaceae bacterium]|nr:hypothetical protein [Chitinophagaceae bacterium]